MYLCRNQRLTSAFAVVCAVADTIAADVMNDLGEHPQAAQDSDSARSTSSSTLLPPHMLWQIIACN
jgi:hypothetical protein